MLIVTIEKRDANTGRQSILHKLTVTNDGTGTRDSGNYAVTLYQGGRPIHMAYVKAYPRGDGALVLVGQSLAALLEELPGGDDYTDADRKAIEADLFRPYLEDRGE